MSATPGGAPSRPAARHVTVHGPYGPRYAEVLTADALDVLRRLDDAVAEGRCAALAARRERRRRLGTGEEQLGFRPGTVRDDPAWSVPPAPADLRDRRVEITGPPTPEAASAALGSGAGGWVADFAAVAPTWSAVVEGQLTLVDTFDGVLGGAVPTVHVRPRGWHLVEKHLRVDCRPLSASVVDAGLFLAHWARRQSGRGSAPYLELPGLESAAEARLWRDLLAAAEELLGLPAGTVRTTVLVETLPAAFELEEILAELGPYACGISAGRSGYLSSAVTALSAVLPDGSTPAGDAPFLRAWTDLLVRTGRRRGAAVIATEAAAAHTRDDAQRAAGDGFDGIRVAHADLVATARAAFAPGTAVTRLHQRRADVDVRAADLLDLAPTPGRPTTDGLGSGISGALRSLSAWLGGAAADIGAVELVRCQVRQQVRAGTVLDDGTRVTAERVAELAAREADRLAAAGGARPDQAVALFLEVATGQEFVPSLTALAYARHVARPGPAQVAPAGGERAPARAVA